MAPDFRRYRRTLLCLRPESSDTAPESELEFKSEAEFEVSGVSGVSAEYSSPEETSSDSVSNSNSDSDSESKLELGPTALVLHVNGKLS